MPGCFRQWVYLGSHPTEVVNMPVDILAIGVHPDDVELSCAGTILKQMQHGHSVAILDLTHGELGTRGSGPLRLEEAAKAAEVLGVKIRMNLGLPDGFFDQSKETKMELIKAVRSLQPKIVLANAVSDRHPDHGRAAKLVHDACFLSGLVKIQTKDESGRPQDRWRPEVIYHYIQDKILTADIVVDITGHLDQKMQSIMAYRSQFFDPTSAEPDSPISGKDFLDFIRARAHAYGRQIGVEHGEGFVLARPVGVTDLLQLI